MILASGSSGSQRPLNEAPQARPGIVCRRCLADAAFGAAGRSHLSRELAGQRTPDRAELSVNMKTPKALGPGDAAGTAAACRRSPTRLINLVLRSYHPSYLPLRLMLVKLRHHAVVRHEPSLKLRCATFSLHRRRWRVCCRCGRGPHLSPGYRTGRTSARGRPGCRAPATAAGDDPARAAASAWC